jgi:hypothetical protein
VKSACHADGVVRCSTCLTMEMETSQLRTEISRVRKAKGAFKAAQSKRKLESWETGGLGTVAEVWVV